MPPFFHGRCPLAGKMSGKSGRLSIEKGIILAITANTDLSDELKRFASAVDARFPEI
jgi:hypothetical protein